jgi:pilus assembly protein Flp/PilA
MDTMLNTYVKLTSAFAAMREEERGATAVEYGLIVALIAAIIIGVVATLGTKVNNNFQKVSNNIPT